MPRVGTLTTKFLLLGHPTALLHFTDPLTGNTASRFIKVHFPAPWKHARAWQGAHRARTTIKNSFGNMSFYIRVNDSSTGYNKTGPLLPVQRTRGASDLVACRGRQVVIKFSF